MEKFLFYILFGFANTCCLVAQPSIQWQKSLGGTSGDFANAIHQTADGGYIVAGSSVSTDGDVTGNHGGYDCWIVKLNTTGDTLWQKSFGGTADENAYSIQQTIDSGFVVAASTSSANGDVTGNHGGYDYWVIKLTASGTIQWQKCLGGTDQDGANAIEQTTDGGYLVAGVAGSTDGDVTGHHVTTAYASDCWIVKLDSAGTIQWQECLGGTGRDVAYAIRQTIDGGSVVAGVSNSTDGDVTGNHGDYDYWVVKLDSIGTIQWQKSLGGSGWEEAYSIQPTSDTGYIVAGFSNSTDGDVTGNHGGYDYWVVKLDSAGTIQWQKSLGGSGDDEASSIEQTTDEGYVVSGGANSINGDVTGNHGGSDYWIVKLNNTGTIQWQKSLGGSGSDGASSIRQTADSGFIVAGQSVSMNGDVTGNHGGYDYWVVKLNPVISGIEETGKSISDFQTNPNPATQSTVISFFLSQPENISVAVYDITGRLIKNFSSGNLNPGEHHFKWNVSDDGIQGGVYFLNFNGDTFSQSSKLVVVK